MFLKASEVSFNKLAQASDRTGFSSQGQLVLPEWIWGNKFTRRKMIDICCVGSGIKYHSLSYWSIVITSLVELFLTVQKRFRKDFSFRMVRLMKRIFWPQTEKLELPQYKSPSFALTAEGWFCMWFKSWSVTILTVSSLSSYILTQRPALLRC